MLRANWQCRFIAATTVLLVAAAQKQNCSAGTRRSNLNNVTQCSTCAAGQFAAANADNCVKCTPGSFAAPVPKIYAILAKREGAQLGSTCAKTDGLDTITSKTECKAALQYVNFARNKKDRGEYPTAISRATRPVGCYANKFNNRNGFYQLNLNPPGSVDAGTSSKYSPLCRVTSNPGAGNCTLCSAGYSTESLGEAGATSCKRCPPGRANPNSTTSCQATCAAIIVAPGADYEIVSGCQAGGILGKSTCTIGCLDGYKMVSRVVGICRRESLANSSYQNQSVDCRPSLCDALVPKSPLAVLYGCGRSSHSAICLLGCAPGFNLGSRPLTGKCRPDTNASTASYRGQRSICLPAACNFPEALAMTNTSLRRCVCSAGFTRLESNTDCVP
jgi:hypothetical protein